MKYEVVKNMAELPNPETRGGLEGIECKFVHYVPADEKIGRPDMHYVKEVYRYKDGSSIRHFKPIVNYQRRFWITMEQYRNHKQKKESEELSRVIECKSTQSDLGKSVAAKLGGQYIGKTSLRDVRDSPYFYGGDTTAADEINYRYSIKYPIASSKYIECALDIETNIETDEIILISVCIEDEIFTTILKSFLPHTNNIQDVLERLARKSFPEEDVAKSIKLTYVVCDTEVEVIQKAIEQAHKWQPDFLAVWNINYDIPYIVRRLQKFGVDPKDVFSDPRLKEHLRYFKYIEGSNQKVTESGKVMPKQPREQWHVAIAPASFMLIDAMTVYNFVRTGAKQNPNGYSLDAILDTHLGKKFKKLHFEDENTKNLSKIEWHKYMVKHKQFEYVIYNQWDTLSMITLDKNIRDLEVSIRALSMLADLKVFNSGPKKLVTNFTWFYLENGRVLGTKPKEVKAEAPLPLGKVGEDGWIVMLNIDQVNDDSGNNAVDGLHKVNIRRTVYDADAVSAYPSCINAANVSKDTTLREIIKIGNIPFNTFRKQNINYMFGKVNSVDYMSTMCKFPTMFDLL